MFTLSRAKQRIIEFMPIHHGHSDDGSPIGLKTHLRSVGIDIGSSTSHLMFSELFVGYPSLHRRRPEVLERTITSRSPILLTPFSADRNIEVEPLDVLIKSAFRAAQLIPEEIDTGAVIITGEAARRDNARRIAEIFSKGAGTFVCATAGPKLESMLAAHGSGTVALSREQGSTLLNVDLGGGTTKVSLVRNGNIQQSAAVRIGSRLVAYDEKSALIRLEKDGQRYLSDLGYRLNIGDRIGEEVKDSLASRMASVLFDVLDGAPAPWDEFFILPPLRELPKVDGILFSGGVSEYIYGRQTAGFGDLGCLFAKKVRYEAETRSYRIINAVEGIGATVIGASQYSVQLSGETIFIPETVKLPLYNLRVFAVNISWKPPIADDALLAVKKTLAERDPEVLGTPFALAISTPPLVGYGAVQELGRGLREALVSMHPEDRPDLLVFEQNIAQVIGGVLLPDIKVSCIDEISVSDLDFIDIGSQVRGEEYVPVVIKSLAFGF